MNTQFKNDNRKGRQRAFPATHDSDGHHFYRMNISPVSSYIQEKRNREDLQGTSSALMPGNPQRERTTNNSLTHTHPTIKCPT